MDLHELPTALLDSQSGSEQRSSHLAVYKKNTARFLWGDGFLLAHTDEIWEGARESFVLLGNNIPVCHSAPGKKVILCCRLTPESQQSIHPQGALCFLNHQNNSVWWCSYKLLSTPDSINERWWISFFLTQWSKSTEPGTPHAFLKTTKPCGWTCEVPINQTIHHYSDSYATRAIDILARSISI